MGGRVLVFWLLACLAVVFSGCARAVKEVPAKEMLKAPAGAEGRPLKLVKMEMNLPKDKKFGTVAYNIYCSPDYKWVYPGGIISFSKYAGDEAIDGVFKELLKEANYPVSPVSDSSLAAQSQEEPELLVGAIVKDMEANVCYPFASRAIVDRIVTGGGYVEVEWYVYSTHAKKVVYTVTTAGSFKIDGSQQGKDMSMAFIYAYIAAVRNLLAEQGFYDLVIKKEGGEEPAALAPAETIFFDAANPYSGAISDNMGRVRDSVVTLRTTSGHGSGFFIDGQQGLLLTDAHVVEYDHFVTVKLADGRELQGEVLRFDPERDVALVQVAEGGMKRLPLLAADLKIGEDVYAVGSPLYEELSTTLSRGIVSAYRASSDGMGFIQSDVNILPGNSGGPLLDAHGNAVGIAVKGLVDRGSYTGINFFIPIKEALARLNIVGQGEEATQLP